MQIKRTCFPRNKFNWITTSALGNCLRDCGISRCEAVGDTDFFMPPYIKVRQKRHYPVITVILGLTRNTNLTSRARLFTSNVIVIQVVVVVFEKKFLKLNFDSGRAGRCIQLASSSTIPGDLECTFNSHSPRRGKRDYGRRTKGFFSIARIRLPHTHEKHVTCAFNVNGISRPIPYVRKDIARYYLKGTWLARNSRRQPKPKCCTRGSMKISMNTQNSRSSFSATCEDQLIVETNFYKVASSFLKRIGHFVCSVRVIDHVSGNVTIVRAQQNGELRCSTTLGLVISKRILCLDCKRRNYPCSCGRQSVTQSNRGFIGNRARSNKNLERGALLVYTHSAIDVCTSGGSDKRFISSARQSSILAKIAAGALVAKCHHDLLGS
mmetsp:Transcript_18182/g.32116  ORF Transcript_18182/g.32116 Transcript_18182/m.32116 type:complete len:380 (-) Transcript_18182:3738-4877(-)